MNKKLYYSYDDCINDCKVLLPEIKHYKPDAIVAIARGGMILTQLISEAINLRDIYTINCISYNETKKFQKVEIFNIPDIINKKRILIVDDIIDSGDTLTEVLKVLEEKYPRITFFTASIFYKQSACIEPNWWVKEPKGWIEFFWSEDLKD